MLQNVETGDYYCKCETRKVHQMNNYTFLFFFKSVYVAHLQASPCELAGTIEMIMYYSKCININQGLALNLEPLSKLLL